MTIYMTALFAVREEALERSENAIAEFVEYVRENEADTHFYTSLQSLDLPLEFLHVFAFENTAAQREHRGSEAVRRFTDTLYAGLEDEVEFTEYVLVSSTESS